MTIPARFIPKESVEGAGVRNEDAEMEVDTDGQENGVADEPSEEDLQKLHTLLMETQITSGKLVCGNCGHEYKILEGIPNFLLPAHLV